MAVNSFRLLGSARTGFKQIMMIAGLTLIFLFWYTTWEIQMEKFDSFIHETLQNNNTRLFNLSSKEVDVQNDLGNEASWMLLQDKRKTAMKEFCKDMPKDLLFQTILTTPESREQLIVDDIHKAIFCYIPKVDSRNWRKPWIFLTALRNNISSLTIDNFNKAFEKHNLMHTKNGDELKHKLKNYTKVIVVRHPLERLMSSYQDEIQVPNLAKWILPTVLKMRSNATVKDIKWPEFVDYIIKEGVINNKVWRTYEDLCHPCALDYDVIVKFETFNEDSNHFFKSINATESLSISNSSQHNSSVVDSNNLQNYSVGLSESQMGLLRRKYNRDFLLFQYH